MREKRREEGERMKKKARERDLYLDVGAGYNVTARRIKGRRIEPNQPAAEEMKQSVKSQGSKQRRACPRIR